MPLDLCCFRKTELIDPVFEVPVAANINNVFKGDPLVEESFTHTKTFEVSSEEGLVGRCTQGIKYLKTKFVKFFSEIFAFISESFRSIFNSKSDSTSPDSNLSQNSNIDVVGCPDIYDDNDDNDDLGFDVSNLVLLTEDKK